MKILNISYRTFVLLIFCLLLSSCEKLIEVEIPNNQISQENVFQDTQTAYAALAGLYAGLWDNSPLAGDQSGKSLGTYVDDLDCYATSNSNGIYDLYRNLQISSNSDIYSYWTNAYQKIYVANSIIEGVDKSANLSDPDKKRIKGEALLIRSVLFYFLEQVFGEIPLPTTTDYMVNQSIGKIPSAQVLQRLEGDLSFAATLLDDTYRNSERIFVNKKVAQLLLAKIYLLEMRNTDAEALLKEIIASPFYQFQNDISKVFIKSGSHILWQLKPKNSGDGTKESIAYYFTNAAPNSIALTQDLLNAFSTNDLRKQNWIATVTVGANNWSRVEKYKNRTNNTTEYSIVFRLEEVYLLLAEALGKQNKIAEGLPYLNKTRVRAGLIPLTGQFSQSTFITEVLLENRKEFFCEMGHRFFDLKRNDRLNTLSVIKTNWKSYHNLWPLPQKELLLNPNLNPQNDGY